ncbi:VOC family protein [Micromonospora sp. WMMD1082]|uniref:VOC family protein n=1 Tax=Micromonospora sp. WMMD1082 TaxID=3016104 RepID=UPI002417A772|nr:VOC family protein [Micromonospora sp. WMMD1082]MDG4795759.1 VOC family protein [Micromonospora sp. WMMD1082]
MRPAQITVSLPIADRKISHDFYRGALGLVTVGEPAEDGLPEPLQFEVNDGLRLMLVPTGGFGWVLGGREVADSRHSECVLGLSAASPDEVDGLVGRARDAGAEVVTEPGQQPWGYAGMFADPDGHLWMVAVAPDGSA